MYMYTNFISEFNHQCQGTQLANLATEETTWKLAYNGMIALMLVNDNVTLIM